MKKNLSLVFICLLSWLNSHSQIQPPGIAWKRSDRLNTYPTTVTPMDGHDINEESEDWWYDHKNSYEGGGFDPGSFNGFITCGYSRIYNVEYAETNDGCLNVSFPPSPPYISCSTLLNFPSLPDGEINEPSFQIMGLYDQHGKLKWFKTYNDGWLIRVIQTSDGNYVAVGPTVSTRETDLSTELLYNYNASTNPNSYFGTSTCGSNYHTKVNVVKIDPNGDIIWNRIYGYNAIGEGADEEEGVPWDLVEYNIGGTPCIRVVGQWDPVGNTNKQAFMLDILSSDGSMNYFHLYAPTIIGPPDGVHRKFTAIEKTFVGSVENLVVVGNEELSTGDLRLQLYCEEASGTPQWLQYYPGIGIGLTYIRARAVDLCINGNNDILVPVMYNCSWCWWDGHDTEADAEVFAFDITNGNIIGSVPITDPMAGSPADKIRAFDLKIGITNTSDGGFAIVSSMAAETFISRYPSNSVLWNCGGDTYTHASYSYWNADALVIKYDNSGTEEWRKVFDIDDELPDIYPGDQKRQECLYSISETPDGGLVIAGNNSRNFDDCYLVKLYDNCQNTSVEWTYDADVIELSTIGTNLTGAYNIRGSIVIHDGQQLDIDAATIKFADTRKCGIITNIVVEPGGVLYIYNGSILTSLDDPCSNSMWDGIQLIGDNQSDQDPSTQPYFLMDNSTIENARYGVLADMALHSTHENWITPNECVIKDLAMDETQSSGGGFVGVGNQSNFHNCRFSVVLNAYPNKHDYSYIGYSYFTLDGPIKDWDAVNSNGDPLGINSFIKLFDVHWVEFESNNFYIDNTLPLLDDDRGNGISAFDSKFAFWDNNFTSLNRGLDAGASNNGNTFDASCNYMTDVIHGMKINNIDGMVIHGNNIGIKDGDTHTSYGIFMEDCNDYTLQDNTLTYDPGSSNLNEVGIVDKYTSPNPLTNNIKFNQINNFKFSMILEGYHVQISHNDLGLEIYNNEFKNYSKAISVTVGPGIAGKQNGSSGSADNLFENYTCSSGDEKQLSNPSGMNPIDYYNNSNYSTFYVVLQPNCYTSSTITTFTDPTNYNPSNYNHALIGCGPSWMVANPSFYSANVIERRVSSPISTVISDSTINSIYRHFLQDSITSPLDSIIDFFSSLQNSSDYQYIINNAYSKLGHLSNITAAEISQLPDSNYSTQKSIIFLKDSLTWSNMLKSPGAKSLLQLLASSDSLKYSNNASKNILSFLYGESFPEQIVYPESNDILRKPSKQKDDYFSLYPNPFIDQLFISSYDKTISRVKVFDIASRLLKDIYCNSEHEYTINLFDLIDGIYIISILDEHNDWHTYKINHIKNQ